MKNYRKIDRIKAFFGGLVLSAICIDSLISPTTELIDYFNYSRIIVFNRLTIFVCLGPIAIIPITYMLFHLAFKGVNVSKFVGSILTRISVGSLVLSLLIMIFFSIYYTNELESRGYFNCPGIPLGSMPGMAVKYAKSEELCKQKRKY